MKLSVLDLAPVTTEDTNGSALRNTVTVAQAAERLGYHRIWVAEHHNMPGIASSAPAVLIGQIAANTNTIRVGSGGVMLPNHQPLIIAEQFGTLDALFPDRIDLGIGRAPGTDRLTTYAVRGLHRGAEQADDFPDNLALLRGYMTDSVPAEHPFAAITATPGIGANPELWLLGSSTFSAQLAAQLGLPFAFARHFAPQLTMPAVDLYREQFDTTATGLGSSSTPNVMIAVTVIAAESDAAAERLAGPARLQMARLRGGDPGRLSTVEEAAAIGLSPAERAAIEPSTSAWIVGGPEKVRAELDALITRAQPDELMVSGQIGSPADRIAGLELIADLLGVKA